MLTWVCWDRYSYPEYWECELFPVKQSGNTLPKLRKVNSLWSSNFILGNLPYESSGLVLIFWQRSLWIFIAELFLVVKYYQKYLSTKIWLNYHIFTPEMLHSYSDGVFEAF